MPRSRFLLGFATALAFPVVALVLSHVGLELTARWAEAKPGYYLRKHDDNLLLLDRANFSRSGQRRLIIFGASEAGEDFIDGVLENRLGDLSVHQLAFNGAVFSDTLLQLEYLERVYGPAAVPSHVVVALTPRFLANITVSQSPRFRDAVDDYSPEAIVGETGSFPHLKSKSRMEAGISWVNMRARETERYRWGVRAAGVELMTRLRPEWKRNASLTAPFQKAQSRKRISYEEVLRTVVLTKPHWQATHAWKASEHRDMVDAEMSTLRAFARRNHVRLYLVNMPVWPVNKAMFAAGAYEDYLRVLDATRADTPLLDLGDLLPAAEFVDAAHSNGNGALRVSSTTADFIRQSERPAGAVESAKIPDFAK